MATPAKFVAASPAASRRRMSAKRWKPIVFHLVVGILALVMIYPILWLVSSSLKPNGDIFSDAYNLIPSRIAWENYRTGWAGFAGNTFANFFKNSMIIVVISTVGAVASSAVVAYGFARIPFFGKGFWFGCMMMTMMLPTDVTMIPQYVMFSKIGWLSSFKPIIVPQFFAIPFFVFLIMQFIRTIPHDLDEAAKMDGCSKYGIFFRVVVPLIVPALVTSAIFSFYWRWDDFINPLLYLNNPKLYPVSLALKLFLDGDSVNNWGGMFAMATLSLVPIFVVFFVFQRYIVEGISTSGLK